jgi:hypothetical protein
MTQRYEAVAVRRYEQNGEDKAAFTNIGVAWPMKDRDGYTLRLHCLPAPVDGEYQILLFPPKPKEEQPRQQSRQQSYGERSGGTYRKSERELADEIPF